MSDARAFLHELFARAGSQDLEAVLHLWQKDGVLDDVTIGRRAEGKQAVTAYLEEFFVALPDLTYEPQQVIVQGSRGVVHWESASRVMRPFFGFPPSQEPLALRGCDIFEVRDGRVAHEWSWYGDAWLALRLTADNSFARRLKP